MAATTAIYPSNITLGQTYTVRFPRDNPNYKHKLEIVLDKQSTGSRILVADNIDEEYEWTVPLSLLNSIKADARIYVAYHITYHCTTYLNGEVVGTTIGGMYNYYSIPNIDAIKPTVSATLAPVGGLGGRYVQGKSGMTVSISATPKYNATLTSSVVRIYNPSTQEIVMSVTGTATGATLPAFAFYGTYDVDVIVYDSRGATGTSTSTITIHPYSAPRIAQNTEATPVVARCDNDGEKSAIGTYLYLDLNGVYSSVDGQNSATVSWRYKEGTAFATWSTWTAITGTSISGKASSSVVLSLEKTYNVEVKITDTVGETATYSASISRASVTFSLKQGGDGAAFGKSASKENTLELEKTWHYEGNGAAVVFDGVLSGSTVTLSNGKKGIDLYNAFYADNGNSNLVLRVGGEYYYLVKCTAYPVPSANVIIPTFINVSFSGTTLTIKKIENAYMTDNATTLTYSTITK